MGTTRKDLLPTPPQEQLLRRYLDLLLEKNRALNLTAVRDRDTAWTRHILDSLTLVPFVEESRCLIDLGSGGGLPGIPLAIVRPDLEVALLETTGKKARFLEETGDALDLANLKVIHDRAETAGHHPAHRGVYDTVTVRALAALPVVVELALPFLRNDGRLLAMKGARLPEELPAARAACVLLGGTVEEVHTLDAEAGACVVEIRKTDPTPDTYPRRPGLPAKKPLGSG
jgi:16S rRNA (guanine527-N7)-methyltransferase